MLVAGVGAEDAAVGGDELVREEGLRRAALDEGGVILIGDEADFLRVRLVEDREVQLLGDRADGGLFHAADGEQGVLERFAAHAEEDVALVLAMVDAAKE